MRARIVLAMMVLAGSVGLTRADEKPLDRADLDKRIVLTVYDSAVLGTKLFNDDKNHEGCFRLYQGTLMAVQPLLDHRPKLQASVKTQLEKAKGMKAVEGATLLRVALDEIQKEIAPGKMEKTTTLWERLGGEAGVRKIVKDFMLVAIEDPKVNRPFGKKVDPKVIAHLEQMLVEWIGEKSGGLKYTGKSMKDAHKGMEITTAEFDAGGKIMEATLKKNKVSDEDIATIMKVFEAERGNIVEKK
jgi:hemoglobin